MLSRKPKSIYVFLVILLLVSVGVLSGFTGGRKDISRKTVAPKKESLPADYPQRMAKFIDMENNTLLGRTDDY